MDSLSADGSGGIGGLLGGLVSISTTLIARIEAIEKGPARPIGSQTLLGTIGVGSAAEPRWRDSILAAPLLLDRALFMDLAKRSQLAGRQGWFSFSSRNPTRVDGQAPEHGLHLRCSKLTESLRSLAAARATAV